MRRLNFNSSLFLLSPFALTTLGRWHFHVRKKWDCQVEFVSIKWDCKLAQDSRWAAKNREKKKMRLCPRFLSDVIDPFAVCHLWWSRKSSIYCCHSLTSSLSDFRVSPISHSTVIGFSMSRVYMCVELNWLWLIWSTFPFPSLVDSSQQSNKEGLFSDKR